MLLRVALIESQISIDVSLDGHIPAIPRWQWQSYGVALVEAKFPAPGNLGGKPSALGSIVRKANRRKKYVIWSGLWFFSWVTSL